MTSFVRIPQKFFDDHQDRDLPTPKIWRQTKRHYVISTADPHTPELASDAQHQGWDTDHDDRGLIASARATYRALIAAGVPA